MQTSQRANNEKIAAALHEAAKRQSMASFSRYVDISAPAYVQKFFHKAIADRCQDIYEGRIKRLMVFVPPQCGKSTIVTRYFPTWVYAKDPAKKIVNASYSGDLATSFSRDIQRIMTDPTYTYMAGGPVMGMAGLVKNADYFETSKGGYYKAVGVGGSLTGRSADIAIIDDPVKDAMEAYSATYRERTWEWYVNVLATRLHNDSGVILIQTRWHVDDLAGRLLKTERDKWVVMSYPAIKAGPPTDEDPRHEGEPLFPEKHSIDALMEQQERSPRTFAALYQQQPSIQGGNIIRSEWFQTVTYTEAQKLKDLTPLTFFVDTAYTDQQRNDPTGIIATCKIGNDLYIFGGAKVRLKFPDLCRWLPKWTADHGYTAGSIIRVEPKASGLSVIQQLKATTGLNITQTPTPTESKETRLNAISATVESGRVFLVEGGYMNEFITEVCSFPAAPHDEYVDLLCYAVNHHLGTRKREAGSAANYFF